jgi:hypothetical protein
MVSDESLDAAGERLAASLAEASRLLRRPATADAAWPAVAAAALFAICAMGFAAAAILTPPPRLPSPSPGPSQASALQSVAPQANAPTTDLRGPA